MNGKLIQNVDSKSLTNVRIHASNWDAEKIES